jgi:hypothetical protein
MRKYRNFVAFESSNVTITIKRVPTAYKWFFIICEPLIGLEVKKSVTL